MRLLVFAFLIISLHVGCAPRPAPTARSADAPALTTLATAEVTQLANSIDRPVIVEFSVLYGCDPCARMQPQVRQPASKQAAQISIKRADFVTNQPLLQSLGATICPTYVLFTPGASPQIHTSPELLVSIVKPIETGSRL